MCGIIGIMSRNDCVNQLLYGLSQLQNRGYDSAGICTINKNNQFILNKYASTTISALDKLNEKKIEHENSKIGIAHTRWSTHGEKSNENAHPHISSDGKFVLVHNGIIENFNLIKKMLIENNYTFKSETDSEVIVNLLSYNYIQYKNIMETIENTIQQLQGTWGLAIMCIDYPNQIYCTRNSSPILIGQMDDYVMIVSEQSGFTEQIKSYIVLNNMDICVIKNDNNDIKVETKDNYDLIKIINNNNNSLNNYKHWTLKEIYEQTQSVFNTIMFEDRLNINEIKMLQLDLYKQQLLEIDNIIILGCGTSYNAGMIGLYYFKDLCNFNCVQLFDGADFNYRDIPKKGKTALILLSQSGETLDLYRCIEIARKHNLFTIGVINVVNSLIARSVNSCCYLNVGKEVGVASTKSFTSQCILLSMIALWFAQLQNTCSIKINEYINNLSILNLQINNILTDLENKIDNIINIFDNQTSCFVLGKGNCEPIAREGSLKIKEISYIHSESYSSTSLKHGPYALLCENFPVILIALNDENYIKNENAYNEIKSRHAKIILITNKIMENINDINNNLIYIPANSTYSNLLSVIPLQMLAYKLSVNKGINPDMPKNLAKVVTVE